MLPIKTDTQKERGYTLTRMKKIIALMLMGLLLGCSSKPSQPAFHVIAVEVCDRPQLVGTVGKIRFGLNRSVDEKTSMTVACPNFGLGRGSIGKDYPAMVDAAHSLVTITVPVYAQPTFEEFKKGIVQGKQTGTEQVKFEIEHMQEEPR
jgi:hypothetical protein